jgi:hypothetical protein
LKEAISDQFIYNGISAICATQANYDTSYYTKLMQSKLQILLTDESDNMFTETAVLESLDVNNDNFQSVRISVALITKTRSIKEKVGAADSFQNISLQLMR